MNLDRQKIGKEKQKKTKNTKKLFATEQNEMEYVFFYSFQLWLQARSSVHFVSYKFSSAATDVDVAAVVAAAALP